MYQTKFHNLRNKYFDYQHDQNYTLLIVLQNRIYMYIYKYPYFIIPILVRNIIM